MLTLSLLRHAKSSRDDPDLDDFDRPLAARGLRDAPEMGKRLTAHGVRPALIVTSPARRASQTARLVALEIGYPVAKLRSNPDLYLAIVRDLLRIVHALDDGLAHVMLVGHNPGMTDFVNHLGDSDVDNLPTCGYAELEFEHAHWKQVGKGTGRLAYFNFPKNAGRSSFEPPPFRNA